MILIMYIFLSLLVILLLSCLLTNIICVVLARFLLVFFLLVVYMYFVFLVQSSTSGSKISDRFLEMGYPSRVVCKAIEEHGEVIKYFYWIELIVLCEIGTQLSFF